MGVLGGDNAGYPNGRRLTDDVVDIEEQAVAGFLIGQKVPLGDGVNANDMPILSHFPYVAAPCSGYATRRRRRYPKTAWQSCGLVSSSDERRRRLVAALVLLFGGVFRPGTPGRIAARRRAGRGGLQGGFAAATRSARSSSLQSELEVNPKDEQRGRSSASPTSSARARPATRPTTRSPQGASTSALQLDANDSLATAVSARSRCRATASPTRSPRHKAHAIAPTIALDYGVIGDARDRARPLPAGVPATSRHEALQPDLSSYSRVSYARELHGRHGDGDPR